jgi:hypothetical protein
VSIAADILEAARREAAEACTCPEKKRPPMVLMLAVLEHVRGCAYRNERSARNDRLGDAEPAQRVPAVTTCSTVIDVTSGRLFSRPMPPSEVTEGSVLFARSPEVEEWLWDVFIDTAGPLHAERHVVLEDATIGVLWAQPTAKRRGKIIAGQAERPRPPQGAFGWARSLWEWHMEQLFPGEALPDFVLTFSAPIAAEADDASWCALVKHELCHCAQAEDEFGSPRFHNAAAGGGPVWTTVGHDFEEFDDVVEDFGPDVLGGGARSLIEAAARGPRIAPALLRLACGNCVTGAD